MYEQAPDKGDVFEHVAEVDVMVSGFALLILWHKSLA
jgi:hypothetical protein